MRKTKYQIFPEAKIIVEYLSGHISWSDYLEMKKQEFSDLKYNSCYNVITDMRDIRIDEEDLDGLSNYVKFLEVNKPSVNKRKTAVITDNSKHVVHSEILKLMISYLPIELKTVSTYEAAFEWTMLKQRDSLKILNHLEELRRGIFKDVCECRIDSLVCCC